MVSNGTKSQDIELKQKTNDTVYLGQLGFHILVKKNYGEEQKKSIRGNKLRRRRKYSSWVLGCIGSLTGNRIRAAWVRTPNP